MDGGKEAISWQRKYNPIEKCMLAMEIDPSIDCNLGRKANEEESSTTSDIPFWPL